MLGLPVESSLFFFADISKLLNLASLLASTFFRSVLSRVLVGSSSLRSFSVIPRAITKPPSRPRQSFRTLYWSSMVRGTKTAKPVADSNSDSALSDLSDEAPVEMKRKVVTKTKIVKKENLSKISATKVEEMEESRPSKRAKTTTAEEKPKKGRQSKKDKEDDLFSVESFATHPHRCGPCSSPSPYLKSGKPTHAIGAHTSTSGGPEFALLKGSELGANALAMFLKNQRRWESKDLEEYNIKRFRKMMLQKDMGGLDYSSDYILPHGSYLINLGNPDASKREVSYKCFLDDLKRCEQLGIKLYNWHPGSTVGACTKSESLKLVAESINRAHKETSTVICVIENMAGAGNILGSKWEELAEIIEGVEDKSRVGVCIDTCHAFAAGYDIRTKETYEKTIQSFDDIVGLKYLKGMHINDSQGGGLGCNKDRHQNIGLGEIGLAAFRFVVQDPRTAGIPLILETPTFEETEVWAREIKMLYELQDLIGTDEEVDDKLKEMTETWKVDLAAIRKKSGKDQPGPPKKTKKPAPKKGKKGKKAEDDEEDDESGDD